MRIQVDPAQLRMLGTRWQQVAGELQAVEGRLGTILGGLDWEVRQEANVEGLVAQARSQAQALAEQAGTLARYLVTKAQAFEEADQQGVGQVSRIGDSFYTGLRDLPSWWRLPGDQVGAAWGLGSVIGSPPRIRAISLPVAGGASLIGVGSLLPWPGIPPDLRALKERVWNWLRGKGWKTDLELAPPTPVPQPARGRLAELLRQRFPGKEGGTERETEPADRKPPAQPAPAPAQEAKPEATAKPESGATAPPSKTDQDRWWHDVPLRSQQGLQYKGKPTAYGCVPTVTQMVLDYWHAKDPANRTMSAQELLDRNVGQGVFNPTAGMRVDEVFDEVKSLGYQKTEVHTNANLEALRKAVAEGPVIAIVKLGLKTTGYTHAVVVTGISPDGQVRINDPWEGRSYTCSWETFSASWGADFGKGVPKNNFIVIRPT
ncbi:MAG TPA: hypothetical protein ENK56_07985 [Chloroflexi bacterium]|nr:hypothetical protein [Chloroflexota bacterium]